MMIIIRVKCDVNKIVCRRLMNSLLNNIIEHILKSVIVLPSFNFLKMMMVHLKLLIDDDRK